MEKPSFGLIWPETVVMLQRHLDLLLPVAAAFLFLPQLLIAWQLGDILPSDMFKGEGALWKVIGFAAMMVVTLIGQLAVASIVMRDGTAGRTLGGVLAASAALLVPALAVSMIQGIAVGFGILLLIVPGIWLMARLLPAIPLVVSEQHDPLAAIRAAWDLTRGHSLSIMGMFLILVCGFLLVTVGIAALGSAFGVVATIVAGKSEAGWGIGRWLYEILAAGVSALFGMAFVAFQCMLTKSLKAYRQEHP